MPGDNDCLVKLALRANHNHFVAQLITQPLTPSKRIYLGHGHLLGINCPLAQGNLLLLKTVYRISLNYFCKLATATIAVSNHTNWVPRSHYEAIRLPIQADCAVLLSSIPAVDSSLMRLFSTFRSFGPIYQVASNSCHQVL
ncbi:hypothetical protein PCANC_02479 [Puccinia coronata f. sp. avenae]|uniref:Uncharacterized protein n=1 Tax=Puccinia coronata f. sp. avenae TaxID=200324 RepID=A0A2N5W510_9BASI|nr:hypothetical protein PCANC_02479 [Puccinia coronata f. sp. avenae]